VPLVTLLHEYAYPWGRSGARGLAWAVTQRAVLREVVRASAGLVVTAAFRARWLRRRLWLPRREIGVAPVFSNLPVASAAASGGARQGHTVGLFGYAYEGARMELVLDAVREVHDTVPELSLVLLGAPGPGSVAADGWLAAARARGIEHSIHFSGVLPAQQLADELASCAVLLHPETTGPTSRKTTLAGSLASGRPVLALDGPRTWQELRDEGAAAIVAPRAGALAGAIVSMLANPERADALGALGRDFAASQMSLARASGVVRGALEAATGGRGHPSPSEPPRLAHL
jgi:glycosyltransferase involved in cell wall biosynthesis